MKILVLNAGSSSLKYALFKLPGGKCLLSGLVDNIGLEDAHHSYTIGSLPECESLAVTDYTLAFDCLLRVLSQAGAKLEELNAIAHRVVHGGELFQAPARIGTAELSKLRQLNHIAPLHNPANILGIETAQKLAPQIPQIAVFDTAFHHSLPDFAYRYPVPESWYQDYGVRRYGFHGTSHQYVAKQAAVLLEKPLKKLKLISLHLGNGASVCAIKNGKSIDTSMGFSPLEGLALPARKITQKLPQHRREKLGAAVTYYKNHRHQMNYINYTDQYFPIGSGVTEAACKTLIKQRFCLAGMRWKQPGAAGILTLRALVLTAQRWTQFWQKINLFGVPSVAAALN